MSFYLSFSVVFPLCSYILIGVLARKMKLLDDAAVSKMNGMAFRLLFPIMMFTNMQAAASALKKGELSVVWVAVGIAVLLLALLLLFVPRFIQDRARRGTFIQGAFRGNGLLFAIPIITSICGETNVGVVAACLAVLIPFYNIVCVILLKASSGDTISFKTLALGILKNPIIIGAAAGILVLLLRIDLPDVIQSTLSKLSSIVSPMALILLGAGLKFGSLKKDIGQVLAVCFIKLVFYPLLSILAGCLLGYRGVTLISLFVLNCVPTAVGAYTMAKEMGPDGDFAGEVVAVSTIASLFTIFVWITVLSALDLLRL